MLHGMLVPLFWCLILIIGNLAQCLVQPWHPSAVISYESVITVEFITLIRAGFPIGSTYDGQSHNIKLAILTYTGTKCSHVSFLPPLVTIRGVGGSMGKEGSILMSVFSF